MAATNQNPEQIARDQIDERLADAGWRVQKKEALDFNAGECATMLSSRGMYVRTRTRYPVKTKLPVRITLYDRTIPALATVIYSHAEGEGPFGEPGMGLYFEDISPQDQDCLQQYINGEVTKGLTPLKTDD